MTSEITPYVIVCAARTGSTMLTRCLRVHPEIAAHGEVFAPSGALSLEGLPADLAFPLDAAMVNVRDRDPVAFLRDVVFEAGGRRAAGMKFKYEEMLLHRWRRVVRALERDRSVRIVHLRRENLLERFLSVHLAVNVTGIFGATRPEQLPEEVAVELEPSMCARDFERTAAREARFRKLFSRHRSVELTYEELTADRPAALARVEELLGVAVCDLEPGSLRIRRTPTHEIIANFDELASHFAATPHGRFFQRL